MVNIKRSKTLAFLAFILLFVGLTTCSVFCQVEWQIGETFQDYWPSNTQGRDALIARAGQVRPHYLEVWFWPAALEFTYNQNTKVSQISSRGKAWHDGIISQASANGMQVVAKFTEGSPYTPFKKPGDSGYQDYIDRYASALEAIAREFPQLKVLITGNEPQIGYTDGTWSLSQLAQVLCDIQIAAYPKIKAVHPDLLVATFAFEGANCGGNCDYPTAQVLTAMYSYLRGKGVNPDIAFDVLSYNPYPQFGDAEPTFLNYADFQLAIRDVMADPNNGDSEKAVWPSEQGWYKGWLSGLDSEKNPKSNWYTRKLAGLTDCCMYPFGVFSYFKLEDFSGETDQWGLYRHNSTTENERKFVMKEFTNFDFPYQLFITGERPYGDVYRGQAYVVKAFGLANQLFDVKVTPPSSVETTVRWLADANGVVVQPVDQTTALGVYRFTEIKRADEFSFRKITPVYLNVSGTTSGRKMALSPQVVAMGSEGYAIHVDNAANRLISVRYEYNGGPQQEILNLWQLGPNGNAYQPVTIASAPGEYKFKQYRVEGLTGWLSLNQTVIIR